jgi:hypothetical protein
VRHDGLQGAQNGETRGAQLGAMRKGDLAKNFLSATGEPQQDLAPIFAATRSFQKAVRFQSINELDGAVVLDLQALGENADGGIVGSGQSLDREERLILLRLNPGGAGGLLAQILKTAHLVAELRQSAVIESFSCDVSQGPSKLYRKAM